MKKIAILGSTGSIGKSALEVIRQNEDMQVTALSANSSISLLFEQIIEFKPQLVCVFQQDGASELRKRLRSSGIHGTEVVTGMEGFITAATLSETDIVLTAVVGMIGIEPTIAAMKAGKNIALANKETLVAAGHIILPLQKETGVCLLPVDSEHSAIFQSLQGEEKNRIKKILLTASGGPFLHKSLKELERVSVKEALKHPNWSMGAKITVDSSTMVNKGLEVIEAKWLFDVEGEDIEVYVHPQSILHSAVEFEDGSVIGQFGLPNMKLPISYALTYPERRKIGKERLNLFQCRNLEFFEPDMKKFRGLALAYEAIKEGGSLPAVYNAANEAAVSLFLEEKIPYLRITELIEEEMDRHLVIKDPSVSDIIALKDEIFERQFKL